MGRIKDSAAVSTSRQDMTSFSSALEAYKNIGNIEVPIIVRLQGTNADIAKKLIDESGLDVHSAIEFQEAADKVQAVLA